MKKFKVNAEATNRWTLEKEQVQGTIHADSEAWARVGAAEALDAQGYAVDSSSVQAHEVQ